MATIGSSSPLLYVEGTASQVSGSGTKRTIKITAKFKVNGTSSASYFGYACKWRARVGDTYGAWTSVKGTEKWNASQGLRTFTQTLTVDVGTTNSKAITVGIYTDSDISNNWDGNYTWSYTVGKTNTAPVLSGTLTTAYSIDGTTYTTITSAESGTENSIKIPETAKQIKISWNKATDDKDESKLTYYLWGQVNDGSWVQLYNGNNKSYVHTIGSGNEGYSYDYYLYCMDADGAKSNTINTLQFQKNVFTKNTLVSSSTVKYSDSDFILNFTFSGASNTNGNTTFTKTISSDIKIYNATATTSPLTITVCQAGHTVTGCYVLFEDIVAYLKDKMYKGTLPFTLTTTNTYGTKKTSTVNLNADIQVSPTAPSRVVIKSRSYTTIKSVDYLLPTGTNTLELDWVVSKHRFNCAIIYEIYKNENNNGYEKLADVTNLSSLYQDSGGESHLIYTYIPSKGNALRNTVYKVKAVLQQQPTYSSEGISPNYALHYWNKPILDLMDSERFETECNLSYNMVSNTSLPNLNIVYDWVVYVYGTTTIADTNNGNWITIETNNLQTINVSNLTNDGIFQLKVLFKDDSGLSSYQTFYETIGANIPIAFINQYGLGIGGVKANDNYTLNVNGNSYFDGNIESTGDLSINGNLLLKNGLKGNLNVNGNIQTTGNLGVTGKLLGDINIETSLTVPKINATNLTFSGNFISSNGGNLGDATHYFQYVFANMGLINGNMRMGYKSNAEREISFYNSDDGSKDGACSGTYKHSSRIYGGSSESATALALWDGLNGHHIFTYKDGNNSTKEKSLVINSAITFSATGTISSSDRRLKDEFNVMAEQPNLELLYENLKPTSYIYKNGSSHRTHYGFIAQEVENACNIAGINVDEFAPLTITHKIENEDEDYNGITDEYGLRYSEFVSLNTMMIQKLQKRITELETKLNEVESKPN